MKYILLAVIGGAIVFLIMKIRRKKDEAGGADEPVGPDLANLSPTEARKGDLVSLSGASDDFEDIEFNVDRKNRYESGDDEWYEVGGSWQGRQVFLEMYEDDELELSFNFADAGVTLSELGLTEDDLVRMDESQSRSEGFEWNGQRYSYAGSGEIGYFKDGRGEGEGFYAWEFQAADGATGITVEKWEGEPFEAVPSKRLSVGEVKVWRTS